MPVEEPRILLAVRYHEAAQEYLRSLKPENFMESTPQGTQREITLESFSIVRARRRGFKFYNELLVQFSLKRRKKLEQVVPDNMVVIHDGELNVIGSYDVPLQPVKPFWVLEYVSKNNRRKDYDVNMKKYEQLGVLYYLLFEPEIQEMSLYRHNGKRYVSVHPSAEGRCAIPEVEMEVGLLDGWVRYWYQGELLPLPPELLDQVETARRDRDEARRDRDEARRDRDEARRELAERNRLDTEKDAEILRLRQQLEEIQRRQPRNGTGK